MNDLTFDVLLFAAGLGTRLRPLTNTLPKALVEFCGRPLIDRSLEMLSRSGVKRVLINLHHLKDRIRNYVEDGSRWGLTVEWYEEDPILETGGAIKNMERGIKNPIVVTVNSDIVLPPDFTLLPLVHAHCLKLNEDTNLLATLMVRSDPSHPGHGEVVTDEKNRICEFRGRVFSSAAFRHRYMYTGVQVISSKLLHLMPPVGTVFSITRDTYMDVLGKGGHLGTYEHSGFWSDVGTIDSLVRSEVAYSEQFGK